MMGRLKQSGGRFYNVALFKMGFLKKHRTAHHDEIKYIMDQARFPPGAKGLPKHMHFVTPMRSDSPERRNKKPPTP